MSEESWKHKPIRQLSPEERQLAAKDLAITIEDALKKSGFTSFQNFYESLQSAGKQFAEAIKQGFILFKESQKLMKYPIAILSKHGWYISPRMTHTDTIEIAKLLKTNDVVKADEKMIQFFKEEEKHFAYNFLTVRN